MDLDKWLRQSEREFILGNHLGWDPERWWTKLKWVQRFSYELGIESKNLFYFCRWILKTFPKEAMPDAIDYRLEYHTIYEPLKDVGILANGKITKDNIWKVLPLTVKFADKLKGGDWAHHFSAIVCGCYGMDGPWSWHMQRALRKCADPQAFQVAENCQTWVEWYVDLINKTEANLVAETGEPASSMVLRSQDRRELQ